jgi:hypothetical protein
MPVTGTEWENVEVFKYTLAGLSAMVFVGSSRAAVTVSLSPTTPSTAGPDQYDTDNSGAAVQQDYTDNGHTSSGGYGAPSQSFTTPSAASGTFTLNSISVEVNLANSGSYGTFFSNGGTWGLQVSTFDNVASGGYGGRTDNNGNAFSAQYTAANAAWPAAAAGATGTTLNDGSAPDSEQYKTLTSGAYDTTQGNPWVTFTFTGGDALTLLPGTTYSFDVYGGAATDGSGTSTYLDLFRAGSTAYAGGEAYNSYGAKHNFNDDYVNNTSGERTFVVGLTSSVPEPASFAVIAAAGLSILIGRRHRRVQVAR